MGDKLTVMKNIIWAVAIVLCLVALLVGLIFGSASRYYGPESDHILYLDGSAPAKADKGEDKGEEEPATPRGDGTLHTLDKSGDAGEEYQDSLTFLCDSALVGIRDYGLLSGGIATTQVWGTNAGNLPMDGILEDTIKYPNDGSEIKIADAAMVAKPEKLVISIGTDGLSAMNRDTFIYNYTMLIMSIQTASPDTEIICCSLTSVVSGYGGSDGLSSTAVGEANEWIKQVCTDTGAYFLDVASVINNNGYLMDKFASSNGKTLNSDGLKEFLDFVRTHALQ